MADVLGWSDPRWAQAGVTVRKLDYWTTKGLLSTVDDDPHPGSGGKRLWPVEEFEVAARVVSLMKLGFEFGTAWRLARSSEERVRVGVELVQSGGS